MSMLARTPVGARLQVSNHILIVRFIPAEIGVLTVKCAVYLCLRQAE